MAVLSKDDFMKRVKDIIGDSTEPDDLDFMADMVDTYNNFGDTVPRTDYDNLKANYDKLGKDYRDRFFTGNSGGGCKPPKDDDELSDTDIRIKDLFIERK